MAQVRSPFVSSRKGIRMNRAPFALLAPAFCAVLLVLAPVSVRAASTDVGREMETQFGVIGSDSAAGKALNDQLMEIVGKVVEGVNQDHGTAGFQLKSA